jgi:hypothetical protein
MFSHEGYTNPLYGHGFDMHYPDKTANDVPKAMSMAKATWKTLNDWARQQKGCDCGGEGDPEIWDRVRRFAEASGGSRFREIGPADMERKRLILGVAPRYP